MMKNRSFVDCFMLMSTAMSLRNGMKLPDMGRPLLEEEYSTTINISLDIRRFEIIDAKHMIFEMDGVLSQKWVDHRLGANARTRKMAVAGQIWKPMITNVEGLNVIANNEDSIFWRGFGDEGSVLLSEKIRIQGGCSINFARFPFDVQVCQVTFGSFRFPSEEVSLQWETLMLTSKEIRTNEFSLSNISSHTAVDHRASGNFSSATINIYLKRNSNHHLICTGAPTILMAILNYVSLWLNINERTSRFNINLITFCINLYFYYTSTCLLQPVPYFKALDVFVGISLTFSLASLIETFVIDNLCFAEETQFHLKLKASKKEYRSCIYWIELGMKLGFPTFYVFFVTVFGLAYLY